MNRKINNNAQEEKKKRSKKSKNDDFIFDNIVPIHKAVTLPPIITKTNVNQMNTSIVTLSSERWNVEKKRRELNNEIDQFYDSSIAMVVNTTIKSNKKAVTLYDEIFNLLRRTFPPLPKTHSKMILDYCSHIIKSGVETKFPFESELSVWRLKSVGTINEKLSMEMQLKCEKMHKLIFNRDETVKKTENNLIATSEKKKFFKKFRIALDDGKKSRKREKQNFLSLGPLQRVRRKRENKGN
jgi:hypothetical protein